MKSFSLAPSHHPFSVSRRRPSLFHRSRTRILPRLSLGRIPLPSSGMRRLFFAFWFVFFLFLSFSLSTDRSYSSQVYSDPLAHKREGGYPLFFMTPRALPLTNARRTPSQLVCLFLFFSLFRSLTGPLLSHVHALLLASSPRVPLSRRLFAICRPLCHASRHPLFTHRPSSRIALVVLSPRYTPPLICVAPVALRCRHMSPLSCRPLVTCRACLRQIALSFVALVLMHHARTCSTSLSRRPSVRSQTRLGAEVEGKVGSGWCRQ